MTDDELKAMNEARDKCSWANQTNARNSFLCGFEAGLAHARALLAAGASEGQAELTAEDVARQYQDGVHIGSGLPRATCPCGFCARHRYGFNLGDSPEVAALRERLNAAASLNAIYADEIRDLRERIAGMEKDAERYRKWVSYSGFTKGHCDATLDPIQINEHAAIAKEKQGK